jgi:hypothetical protein
MLRLVSRLFVFASLLAGAAPTAIGAAELELSGDDHHPATAVRAQLHTRAPRLVAALPAQTFSLPSPDVARLGAHEFLPTFTALGNTPTRARAPPSA